MNPSTWTMIIGATAGLVLAAYGGWILVAGRAPTMTMRSFRCARDAGFYHLLFGLALALVVVGTGMNRGVLTLIMSVTAIGLAGFAVVRFRPRGHRPGNAGSK